MRSWNIRHYGLFIKGEQERGIQRFQGLIKWGHPESLFPINIFELENVTSCASPSSIFTGNNSYGFNYKLTHTHIHTYIHMHTHTHTYTGKGILLLQHHHKGSSATHYHTITQFKYDKTHGDSINCYEIWKQLTNRQSHNQCRRESWREFVHLGMNED